MSDKQTLSAHEMFPYADIDPALTLTGLINHRWLHRRKEYARVIAGTDEQLAVFVLSRLQLHHANFGLPYDADWSLALHLSSQLEEVIVHGVSREFQRHWYSAYKAGMKQSEQMAAPEIMGVTP